jgi:fused signal recognition particle receptor
MNNILDRWKKGLQRSSKAAFGQIATILGATDITDETWDELEALLIRADVGVETTIDVLDRLEDLVDRDGIIKSNELQSGLISELKLRVDHPKFPDFSQKPMVILIVGVNGSGKTTTIAKLASYFKERGKKVLLGAADTYRAAAVDQLEVWAERLNIPIISGQPGGDAGAVAYDTIQSAISRGIDVVLIDTAGRLHTRYNLMEELKKVYRVINKSFPGAPHAVWLVMDATTGQNAIHQARAFKEAVNVTGIILAKLDSSARGGMVFAIQKELGLPILYAGLGEKPGDLEPFDTNAFVEGILNI